MSNLVIETSDPTVRFGEIPVYGLTKKVVEDVIDGSKVLSVEQIEMIQKILDITRVENYFYD